jgi:hypothetical protein
MDELFIRHTQGLILCGDDSVRIGVPLMGLPRLAALIRRKLSDVRRQPNEAITLYGKQGSSLVIPPKDAQALLNEVVALMGQASKR